MNSVVFHFPTVCGIWLFFDAVLRYLATFSCGIAVLGPPEDILFEEKNDLGKVCVRIFEGPSLQYEGLPVALFNDFATLKVL